MFRNGLRLPSPAIVISMIALALVLGGTAVAASTATDPDKTADTKLVKTLAPKLSVKHAKTATLLGSKNAVSLETSAYTYQLPDISGVGSVNVDLPGLPAGIYYASYDILTVGIGAGQEVGCDIGQTLAPNDYFALSYGVPADFGSYMSTSGSGVVDTRTNPVQLQCFASTGTFSVLSDEPPPDLTFVPIDQLHTATGTAAARRAHSSRVTHASTR